MKQKKADKLADKLADKIAKAKKDQTGAEDQLLVVRLSHCKKDPQTPLRILQNFPGAEPSAAAAEAPEAEEVRGGVYVSVTKRTFRGYRIGAHDGRHVLEGQIKSCTCRTILQRHS